MRQLSTSSILSSMNNTRIFVSSTCYDLAAIRESIREMILDLGHEPLLSEYPSFPVSPDANHA